MVIIRQKITFINIRKPKEITINEELKWFGNSLGLFSLRDKNSSCFRIFIELLKASKKNLPLSSDEIAYNTKLTRGTVIHHLNKLIEAGIVISNKNRYMLRVDNLEILIDELEKDMHRVISNLRGVAKELDHVLGL